MERNSNQNIDIIENKDQSRGRCGCGNNTFIYFIIFIIIIFCCSGGCDFGFGCGLKEK